MRNLSETRRRELDASNSLGPDAKIYACAWDTSEDSILCVFSNEYDSEFLKFARIAPNGCPTLHVSWDSSCPELSLVEVHDIHYFPDLGASVIVFAGGDIVKVGDDETVEVIGTFDAGITATAWSPDEEVLAITTAAGTLVLMTRDLEPIEEIVFTPSDHEASKHVSVGWGKAETQFQGKRAKAMRDPTVPEKVDQGELSPFDDDRTFISWRGDGAFLSISRRDEGSRRLIRVYNREGILDSVSEPIDGLESPLSWRPSGNIICGVQRTTQSLEIIFFERNGLRHGGFQLKVDSPETVRVKALFWNADSTVLAVCLEDRVQLWCMGNYHWYLKQELISTVPVTASKNRTVYWHPEKALTFFLHTNQTIYLHDFSWKTSTGSTCEPNDWGIVTVVDGYSLNITPLRLANIPPPMCYLSLPLGFVPRDTAISNSGSVIAALDFDKVAIIRWKFKSRSSEPVIEHHQLPINRHHARQVVFVDDDTLCALVNNNDRQSTILTLSLAKGDMTDATLDAEVSLISPLFGENSIICHERGGNIFIRNLRTLEDTNVCSLPTFCSTIVGVRHDDDNIVYALSESGRLYCNDRLVATSCNSICLTKSFLIFTTTQHKIRFLPVGIDESLPDIANETSGPSEQTRNVERGSRIVCAIPSKFSVVLQMPRGNLETIYPRALVLDGIRRSIKSLDYKKAFLTCRHHRVDLNILHDYLPDQLSFNIPLFLQQLGLAEYIDLFLSQLRDEDVTVTMYPEIKSPHSAGSTTPTIGETPGKVNRICDAVIEYMRRELLTSNVQSIVTAYVCKSPPDTQSALGLISTLKGTDGYEKAITHICFLCDVNKLYDTALGTYDLELALMIAQQAQKDPREYLPFLQKLQEMDDLRRQFTIDDHLARHSKALVSLFRMGADALKEVEAYVVKNVLYSEALDLYKADVKIHQAFTELYANYLFDVNRYDEAGFAFEFLRKFDLATTAYQKAGLWRESLFSASQQGFDKSTFTKLCHSLARDLHEAKNYEAEATIYLEYLEDIPEALRALCKANAYEEAMRLAIRQNDETLLKEVLEPALLEALANMSEFVMDIKGQITAQGPRILELRAKAKEDPLAYFDGTNEADAPDDVSLAPTHASTSASLFTRYTNNTLATAVTGASRKTSKNRRKEERKRARGKKGSVYEEEYLVNSVRRLLERVNSTLPDIERLIQCLYRRQLRDNAATLQQHATQMVELLQEWKGSLFPALVDPATADDETKKETPVVVVRAFKKLSLI